MSPSSTIHLAQTMPSIPQEIVNLIVDEVAFQSHTSEPHSGKVNTLKSCSIVSQSFHSQSRRRIFSEIDFKLDRRGQGRASKLTRILGNKEQDGLINDIRSFTFTIDIPSTTFFGDIYRTDLERTYFNLQQCILRFLKNLKLDRGNSQVVAALDALSPAPRLESFGIISQRGFYPWNNDNDGINTSLVRLCANDSLRSLRLERILGVPESLLIGSLFSSNLRELKLSNISISREATSNNSAPIIVDLSDDNPRALSRIEKLEITGFRCTTFFEIFRSPTKSSTSFTPSLPYLRALAFSIPTTQLELDDVWQFLLHVSSSLETLEMQHYQWSLQDMFSQSPIRLSSLTSLRNLSLTTTSFDTAQNFSDKLEVLGKFLASDTSPAGITSITIDLYVHRSLKNRHRDMKMSWKDLKPNPGWEAIDSALSSPTFAALRKAVFNVRLFYFARGSRCSHSRLERTIDVRTLLPRIAEVSLVDAEVNLHALYSAQSFLDRFYVL